MRRDFSDFIRNGQNGVYVLAARGGSVLGHQPTLSVKSTFPNYRQLRANFEESLNEVDRENAQMLLNALTPPDTVPRFADDDILDVTDAKDEALKAWDARLRSIFSQYQSHPQRLRPLRIAMEERLLRAFAGLINELRQEDMGITHYVWVTREDERVRSSHATRHGQVFSWRSNGIKPGQEPGCRCVASPRLPQLDGDVVLADLALPSGTGSGGFIRTLASRATALTPLGAAALAALEASNLLQNFTRYMSEVRIRNAAEIIGADLNTAEGILAAVAHELVYEAVISGLGSSTLPKTSEAAEIAGQAAALFEMLNPGTLLRVAEGDTAAQRELGAFVGAAFEAFEQGRLVLQNGSLANGWVEVFPELTDDERRLGQLPGFNPERLDQFLEEFPAEDLGLPDNTGTTIPEDPTDSIISTPITDETGPNIVNMENPHSKESVTIRPDRERHILDGDGRSGGHRAGTSLPGKTEFPEIWSDEEILEAIKEVAGSGTVDRTAHRDGELVIVGEINGVTIETVVKRNGEIRTAYPLSGPGVVTNAR